jgi:hypothetical protein
MNNLLYTIKEPILTDEVRIIYEKLKELKKVIHWSRDVWFGANKSKTADLIMKVDVSLFSTLHNIEMNRPYQINVTREEIIKCFYKPRNGNKEEWETKKNEALSIFDSITKLVI